MMLSIRISGSVQFGWSARPMCVTSLSVLELFDSARSCQCSSCHSFFCLSVCVCARQVWKRRAPGLVLSLCCDGELSQGFWKCRDWFWSGSSLDTTQVQAACEMEMHRLVPHSLLLLGHERAFCQNKRREHTKLSKNMLCARERRRHTHAHVLKYVWRERVLWRPWTEHYRGETN